MTATATPSEVSKPRRWPIRITLYQTFMLFSIVAAWLLLHRIEGQQIELRTKRATLFSLNRDLYIDNPERLAGIQRFVSSPHELSWSVFIPRTVRATLMVSGKAVCELAGGMHQIRAKLHRQINHVGPAQIDVEKLFVDDVGYDVELACLTLSMTRT